PALPSPLPSPANPDGCYPAFTTAEACNALKHLTTGAGNTAMGWYSLFEATTASYNTALGRGTLVLDTADSNTATGAAALLLNVEGTQNCAYVSDAFVYNGFGVTGGNFNNAFGSFSLYNYSVGYENTAYGHHPLFYSLL